MENMVFETTHLALEAILEVTPLASRQAVLQYAKECLPYTLTTDTRYYYICGCVLLCQEKYKEILIPNIQILDILLFKW